MLLSHMRKFLSLNTAEISGFGAIWAILMKPKARRKPRDIDKPPDRISQNISITHAQHLTR